MTIPLQQYWQLLVHYLKPQWRRSALLAGLIFGNLGLQLVNPQILSTFIDNIQSGAPPNSLMNAALLFLGLAVVQQIVAVGVTYVSENVGWTATNALRTDLVAHTLNLDLSFHKARTPGEMIERIDGDVTALSNFFSQFVIQIVGNILLILGVIILLFREDWRISLVIALFSATTLVVLIRLRNLAVPHWAAEREANAAFFGFLEERLAGTEDIRANGARTYVMRRFFMLMRDQLQKSLKAGWMINIVLNVTFILFALGTAGAFAVSTILFRRQMVTIGTVYLVYHYTKMLEAPLRTITYQLQQLQRAGASVGRVRQLLDLQSRLAIPKDDEPVARTRTGRQPGVQLPTGALSVRFSNVSFGYDDRGGLAPPTTAPRATAESDQTAAAAASPATVKETVLHDVNFELAPGAVMGLLGRTGSGKSTLIRLLVRFYDPDTGTITLCGATGDVDPGEPIDLRTISLDELRRRVGVVTQEIQLFNASVRDNLTFFDPTIQDDAIVEVIEMLGMGPWLESLPQGLETVLDAGGGLSAGEAQLLAFTRIFLQDPGLVILDEASSRLDPATEHLIERAIDRLLQGRTAIIIAHRLGTVQRADEILILESGRVLERGDRQALAQDRNSHFYQLLQTGLQEVMA
jgi:ABC-type multidrug transport system fused ATPase/permease subunit